MSNSEKALYVIGGVFFVFHGCYVYVYRVTKGRVTIDWGAAHQIVGLVFLGVGLYLLFRAGKAL